MFPNERNFVSKKRSMYLLTALLVSAHVFTAQTNAMASDSSICNSMTCENPQSSTVFGGDLFHPVDRQAHISTSNLLNIWKEILVLIPIIILLLFQIGESRMGKSFSSKK